MYIVSSLLFATTMVMTISKTVRDRFITSLKNPPPGHLWIRGNLPWFLLNICMFLVSIGLTVHAVTTLNISGEDQYGLIMSLYFMMSSAASLAKVVRDRQDAALWETSLQHTQEVFILARGTLPFVVMILLGFMFASISSLVLVWISDKLEVAMRIALTGIAAFQMYAGFMLAKTVRDAGSSKVTSPTQTTWALVIVGFVVALVVTYVYIRKSLQTGRYFHT